MLSSEQVNLTTTSSTRLVLTQLPPPPPPRPMMPPFASQPPAWAPFSQQTGDQGFLGNGCGFKSSLTQSQGCGGGEYWPSVSSSLVSFSDSSGYQSAPSFSSFSLPLFQPASSLTSSSSLPLFQPAISLTSSSPSSVLSPLPPPSQAPVAAAPKLVPIFKNKCPSHHVNVALLRLQKEKEQQSGGGEVTGRVTLPTFRKKTPSTASSSSSSSSLSAVSLPIPPPTTISRFNRRSKPPEPTVQPNVKHIHSLSPASKSRPGLTPAPKLEIKFKSKTYPKTILKKSSERRSAANDGHKVLEQPSAAPPLTSSDISSSSSRRGVSPIQLVSALKHRCLSCLLLSLVFDEDNNVITDRNLS